VLYSICVEDVQEIAREELGRPLSDFQLRTVERKIGDYIDWQGAVACLLGDIIAQRLPQQDD